MPSFHRLYLHWCILITYSLYFAFGACTLVKRLNSDWDTDEQTKNIFIHVFSYFSVVFLHYNHEKCEPNVNLIIKAKAEQNTHVCFIRRHGGWNRVLTDVILVPSATRLKTSWRSGSGGTKNRIRWQRSTHFILVLVRMATPSLTW